MLDGIVFYHILVKGDPKFVLELKKYIEMSANDRRKALETEETNKSLDDEIRLTLRYFKSDSDLWQFLSIENNFKILSNIADWEVYRRAVESAKDLSSEAPGGVLDPETFAQIHNLVQQINSYLIRSKGAQMNALGERLYTLFKIIRNNYAHNYRLDIHMVSSLIDVLISVQKQLERIKSPDYMSIMDLSSHLIELLRSISLPADKKSNI